MACDSAFAHRGSDFDIIPPYEDNGRYGCLESRGDDSRGA